MKAVTGVKHCCITDIHAPENAEKDNYVVCKEIKRLAVDCFQQKQLEYGKAESGMFIKRLKSGCCCQLIDFISSDMFKASAKSLHQEERMQEELEKNEIKSMSEIFTKNEDPIKFIYITAETGSCKSTFCKNLIDGWCMAHSGGHNDELMKMKKFDFINSQSIKEMHETQYDKTKIVFKLLENDAAKINVIPDGLDEWSFNRETRNDFQAGFPEHNITIVTTSRPWKILYSLRPLKNIETNLYPLKRAKYIQPAFGDFIGKEINLDTAFGSITVDQDERTRYINLKEEDLSIFVTQWQFLDKLSELRFLRFPECHNEIVLTCCKMNIISTVSLKERITFYSDIRKDQQCCRMFHNIESIVNHNKHTWNQLTNEHVPYHFLENNLDIVTFLLPNICSYIELELNHINCEYISALIRGDCFSKKLFDAWLNRLIFRSLDDKHLCLPDKSKMTDKMCDLEKVWKDIMSEPGQTVDIHERENSIHASENEENNCNHSYFHSVGGVPNEILQAGESTSVITLNQRHQLSGTTVDLKTQQAGLFQGESNNESPNKEVKEKDPMKTIICHGNYEIAQKIDIISAPAFHEKINEPSHETARNDNGDDHLSDTDRLSNVDAMHNESITPGTPGLVTIDAHLLSEASGLTTDIVPDSDESTKHSLRGCDQPTSNQELEYRQKTDHSEECLSTLSSQAPEPSNAAGIPDSYLPTPEVDTAELQRFEPLMHVIDKIAGGERVPPQVTMQYELLRFCTLRSFPKHNKPYITRIAQAGFYFANTDDEVVCYCCARRRSNWREDDIPIEIHRELNPNCSFLLRNLEVNVPVRMSELLIQENNRSTRSQSLENASQTSSASTSDTISCNTSRPTSHSSTTANTSAPNVTQAISSPVVSANSELSQNILQSRAHGNFVMTSSASSFVQKHQSNSGSTSNGMNASPVESSSSLRPTSQLSAPGTDTSATPKYPKYASKTARVSSYNDCGDIVIPPDSLATSGFFYAGFGDCVRCFQCGVGLRHWSEEDDPWIEHSRWSKDCLFVKQVKGQEFVNIVQMAVQYSQNQNGNDQTHSESPTGSSFDAEIERQMHTDAAQSVLDMGYTPHVIRSALRAIRDGNDGRTLSATILMEKIFELEDEASANVENNQSVQGTPLNQSNTIVQAPDPVDNNTQSQRVSLDTSLASSNSTRTQSVPASLTTNASSGATRTQNKKSQLLEQKKLKQENEQLKQQSLCTKCKQNDVCIVFLPCGHLITCETCAPTIRYCSVEGCGKYIKGTVRTYLA